MCGLAKAARRFDVVCVCAVGATAPDGGKYAGRLASVNRVQVPLFYLRGGLDYSRMSGAEGALLRKLVPKVMGVGTDGATRKMFAEAATSCPKRILPTLPLSSQSAVTAARRGMPERSDKGSCAAQTAAGIA